MSFKPPAGPSTWTEVGSGARDADLRARARRYAAFSKPIVVTFHHEPTNDSTNGDAWAKAFIRIYDVMRAETGLKNVAFAPIIGDWAWNPKNPDQTLPTKFLTPDVMRRMAFLGVDLYQNASGEGFSSRLGRIYTWMAGRGFGSKMLGIGETGATESFASKTAVQWWSEQWAWVGANTDKIGVVSYFNSTRNSKDTVYWGLDESAVKLTAYKASLTSKISARLA